MRLHLFDLSHFSSPIDYHQQHRCNLLSNIIMVIKTSKIRWMVGLQVHVERTREIRKAYKMLNEEPEGRMSLWRPSHSSTDNIKMDLQSGMSVWIVFTGS